jgi:hypothetical protein
MIANNLRLYILSTAFLSFSAFAQDGETVTWHCSYKGSEIHTNVTPTTKFEISGEVTWVGSPGSWTISGKAGDSILTGTCNDSSCKIDEKTEADGTYYWEGTYTEENTVPKAHSDIFVGTWGKSANDRKSAGTWEGKEDCTLDE